MCMAIVLTYRNVYKERNMNIAKNMEVIFLAATVLLGSYAYTSSAAQKAAALAPIAQISQADVQVVVVKGHRLTAKA